MCGILLCADIQECAASSSTCSSALLEHLRSRGPDAVSSCSATDGAFRCELHASVLAMRAAAHRAVVTQPLASERWLFAWNGEIFPTLDEDIEGIPQFEGVPRCENDTETVWKRLCTALAEHHVAEGASAQEVCAVLHGVLDTLNGPFAVVLVDKALHRVYFARDRLGRRSLLLHVPHAAGALDGRQDTDPSDASLPPDAHRFVLCSAGTIPGYYAVEVPIGAVFCAALERGGSAFRLCGSPAGRNGRSAPQSFPARLGAPDSAFPTPQRAIDVFHRVLEHSVRERCNTCTAVHAPVAVLFSGGLDSTVLAALAAKSAPRDLPIELINISFMGDAAPDRVTGLQSVDDLRRLFPTRDFTFIRVDVTEADIHACREHVVDLISPCSTVMDFNIGTALYLAARGEGVVDDTDAPGRSAALYCAQSRVLLAGMGADEQLCGYARHRTAFRRGGEEACAAEIEKDFARLWKRNLGRDDRCIAAWAREPRFPFLDERVVAVLRRLPLSHLADFTLPPGTGDKWLLRQVAESLGLQACTKLPKRAIQFGSRIAKLVSPAAKGSDLAAV